METLWINPERIKYIRLSIILSCICFFPFSAFCQQFFRQSQEIPVWIFQHELRNPWVGGLNNPQFSTIDLDKDGLHDLIAFDRTGNRLNPFIYEGLPGTSLYRYSPEYESAFPSLSNWVLCVDYNLDGLKDIFTAHEDGIGVYTQLNNSSNPLVFEKQLTVIQTEREGIKEPLLINSLDIPALTDIDLDGDMDILAFELSGTFVEYHLNRSQELFGHHDSLVFARVDACWGGFMEALTSNSVLLNILCKQGGNSGLGYSGIHAGSTLLAFDADGDQDKDLLLGDISYSNMVMLTNGGNAQFAEITAQTNSFPSSLPIQLDLFPAAFFEDIDHDGKRDLLVAPGSISYSEDQQGIWYYRNGGTDNHPVFSYMQNDFLQDEMIDLGSGAKPILIDYDGDGLKDLLVANDGTFDGGLFPSFIYLFRNAGSAGQPEFHLITKDLGNLTQLNYQGHVYPALADLDQDGDLDMILGKSDGSLDLFENISFNPTDIFPLFIRQQINYLGIDIGNRAAPTLFDLNADSLPDLIIGEQNGNLNYWQHNGTSALASFQFVTDSLGKVSIPDIGNTPGTVIPLFYESQGHTELIIGQKDGKLFRYSHIQLTDPFSLIDSMTGGIDVGLRAAPALADLNADGRPDLIIGNQAGGLELYLGTDSMAVGVSRKMGHPSIQIFPNPAKSNITLKSNGSAGHIYEFRLLDLSGKEILYRECLPLDTVIALPAIPAGIYLVMGKGFKGESFETLLMIQN